MQTSQGLSKFDVCLSQVHVSSVAVGRAELPRGSRQWTAEGLAASATGSSQSATKQGLFSCTAHAMRLLERVAVALQQNEPLLMVSEQTNICTVDSLSCAYYIREPDLKPPIPGDELP
eukprot:scaffold75498_cov36-Prasinocladus_malaysianus.AAC.2